MQKIKNTIVSLTIFFLVVTSICCATYILKPDPVFAQSVNYEQSFLGGEYQRTRNTLGKSDTSDPTARVVNTIDRVLKFIFTFVGIILTLITLYAGFLWMTAAGDSKKVETAKKYLTNAVIGLVILLSASGVSLFVFNQLQTRITNSSSVSPR